MPAALLERVMTTLPDLNLSQGYGMTECSSVLTFLTAADHRRGGPILRSAGRPMIGVNLSVRRKDDTVAAPGENGEICARAGNFMREYWHQPELTDERVPRRLVPHRRRRPRRRRRVISSWWIESRT